MYVPYEPISARFEVQKLRMSFRRSNKDTPVLTLHYIETGFAGVH
jgi:hypothetical protein